jgi:hypothetical protein
MNSEEHIKKQKPSLDNDKIIKKSNDPLKDYKIEGNIAQSRFGKVKLGIHKKTNEKVCLNNFIFNKSL